MLSAALWSTPAALATAVSRRTASTPLTALRAALAIPVALAVETTVLTNREIWSLPFWSLTLGARQSRANQRTMHRPFVLRF